MSSDCKIEAGVASVQYCVDQLVDHKSHPNGWFFKHFRGFRQPVGDSKAWSTRILEPTDHISRVGQDSEVTKSTRSVVIANPVHKVLSHVLGNLISTVPRSLSKF